MIEFSERLREKSLLGKLCETLILIAVIAAFFFIVFHNSESEAYADEEKSGIQSIDSDFLLVQAVQEQTKIMGRIVDELRKIRLEFEKQGRKNEKK